MSFLEIRGVEKYFGSNHVLRGVNLEVDEHNVVCLIGASGSGKSTLLRCINGLEPIQDGTIVVDGRAVSQLESSLNYLRRHVGIVFQSFNLFPHMNVLKNVTLAPRKVLCLSKDEAEERAPRAARTGRAVGQGLRVPRPPLGWPAAAGRDRARTGNATDVDPARRDHQRPRPGAHRRGARDGARAQGRRNDDAARDARDGIRA